MLRRLTIALIPLAAIPLAALSPAFAQSAAAPMPTQEFVTKAAQSDQFEIQEGQLAEKKGSAQVKGFGEHMVRDHTKLSSEMAAAVKKAGMTPPAPSLPPEQQAKISQLQNLSGAEFDHAYLTQQIEAHQQAVAMMRAYAKTGDAAPIKAAAQKATPIIEQHLQMAEKLAKQGAS